MKPLRLLLFAAGALVLVAVVVLVVVFSSSFQTWAARKALAAQPGLRATVGSVSAGLHHVEAKQVHVEQNGIVLTVPAVEADVPLLPAALSRRVSVARLVAKGWTLDLSGAAAAAGKTPATQPPPLPQAAAQAFAGVFGQLGLPADTRVDGLELNGTVILPDARGRVAVALHGGGLSSGREGRFTVGATATLANPSVSAAEIHGEILATMDTPRTFTRIVARLDASANGTQFPKGVKVSADAVAARSNDGETYSATVTNAGAEIFSVQASYPRAAQRLDGTWKLDVRDADVAPFALGLPLPAFTAVGEGKLDADASFEAVHAQGRLNATADRLQVLKPELAVLGELKIAGEFDVAERGGVISVSTFQAAVAATEPVATVRTLQAFEFNPRTGELRAADPARELLGVELQGVPLAWAGPFLPGIELTGTPLRGEFAATPRGGGVTLHSISPIATRGVHVSEPGRPLVRDVAVALNVSADYTPKGWQAEVSGLTAKSADATLISLDAKAGQLAGTGQPVKATGRLVANLPALLAQPVAAGAAVITSGEAAVDFVASANVKKELQAKLALKDLATVVEKKAVRLPAISADLRADLASDGTLAFHVPLVLERNARKSDLTLDGTVGPEKNKARAIDAHLASSQLFVDDAQTLAGVVPSRTTAEPGAATDAKPASGAPPWSAIHGSVAVELKRVVYSDTFEVTDMSGRIRIDEGMLKLERVQAGLGETGRATVEGALTFDGNAVQPYGLAADVLLKDVDPGPLVRAFNGNQPPIVEGRFDVTSTVASHAPTLTGLLEAAGGEFRLTSKGGVFRGLPVNVGNLVENTSRLANWIASAGTALKEMTGRRDDAEVANKAQAVAELTKRLYPLPYDQLGVVVTRDPARNIALRDFTLIAPEVRLSGDGALRHQPGAGLLDDELAMEFKLRAQGRSGELLKYLGVLESHPDELGYAACTVPFRVTGTLRNPDAAKLSSRLAALALEKSGVAEKASELINKVFGGGGK